jgi:hypothetical protein
MKINIEMTPEEMKELVTPSPQQFAATANMIQEMQKAWLNMMFQNVRNSKDD